MRSNRLRQLLNEDKPSLAMHISSPSPDLAEIIGQTGAVDYIEVLAEYWPYDLYDFDNFARATEFNTEDSEFFITLKEIPIYQGEYTPIGKVVYGLDILTKIKTGNKAIYVLRPDYIKTFRMFNSN